MKPRQVKKSQNEIGRSGEAREYLLICLSKSSIYYPSIPIYHFNIEEQNIKKDEKDLAARASNQLSHAGFVTAGNQVRLRDLAKSEGLLEKEKKQSCAKWRQSEKKQLEGAVKNVDLSLLTFARQFYRLTQENIGNSGTDPATIEEGDAQRRETEHFPPT